VKDRSDQAITLTADEAAFIRQALAACSGIFSRAMLADGPGRQALEQAALEVVADGRPLGQVHSSISLAIDYVDFARPAGSTR